MTQAMPAAEKPKAPAPVATTAELEVDVGAPAAVTEVPLTSAAVRGAKATLVTMPV